MKSTELRIGNWVFDTKNDHNQITIDALRYIEADTHHQIKPIPLTEEWLLKFKDCYTDVMDVGYHGDDFPNHQMTALIDKSFSVKIKHVHQLQNLYFALTGEELTINE